MNNITNQELWVKSLQVYRDMWGFGSCVIRSGTNPILDLVILEQVDSSLAVWYVYCDPTIDSNTWAAIQALPGYEHRINVASAAYITQRLTGWPADMLEDAWVMAVDPCLANK